MVILNTPLQFFFDYIHLYYYRWYMVRKIVITSGKGGVGKTTIVSALGATLARKGMKVLLIDMDFGLNNLDVVMGVENKVVYDIIDVLEGKCLPRQAVIEDIYVDNLFIFPSTHGFCSVKFGANELIKIINDLECHFDFILIDCPAGIDGGFRRAVECAKEYIVVTTPHLSAIRDADKVCNAINAGKEISPYIIVNKVRGDLIQDKKMLGVDIISEHLSGELIGVVPTDDVVEIQMYEGGRFSPNSSLMLSMDYIARFLLGGDKKIFDYSKKYRGVIGGVRKKLRRLL